VNRSLPRAKRLADNIRELGVEADAFPFDHLPPVLTALMWSSAVTGAVRPVVSLATCTAVLRTAKSRSSWRSATSVCRVTSTPR